MAKKTKVPKLTQKNADNITAIQLEMTKIGEQISNISKGLDKLTFFAPNVTKLSDMLKTPVLPVPAPTCKVSYAEALQARNIESKPNVIPSQMVKHSTSSGSKKELPHSGTFCRSRGIQFNCSTFTERRCLRLAGKQPHARLCSVRRALLLDA